MTLNALRTRLARVLRRVLPGPAAVRAKAGDVGLANAPNRVAWVEAALASVPAGHTLLDAGAGEGRYRDNCQHLTYVAQDFDEYDGSGDGVGLQTGEWNHTPLDIVSDITAIPRPDASFDAVLCSEVFEHIPDPLAALNELTRLLKPGGQLILSAPFASFTHFAPFYFQNGFSRYFYEHHLPKLGYRIDEIDHNGSWFEFLAQELRRLPDAVQQHTGQALSLSDLTHADHLLARLAQAKKEDQTSSQFACFGLHVRATKLPPGESSAP